MSGAFARSLLAAVAGFIAYGGWAFWVNADYGTDIGIRSALVQGSWSFALTLSMTLLMEWLLRVLSGTGYPGAATAVLTVLILFCGSWTVNWLGGTPDILATILPGFLIGSVYSISYIWAHRRADENM